MLIEIVSSYRFETGGVIDPLRVDCVLLDVSSIMFIGCVVSDLIDRVLS